MPLSASRLAPIEQIAAQLNLTATDWEPFGRYKAKFSLGLSERLSTRPAGKYIGVTAVNPTPLGEGKTVVAIGLAMALRRVGRTAIAVLRQPSLAPMFGIKGGGAGGGRATLEPADAGEISSLPGLPAEPAARRIDIDAAGRIIGLLGGTPAESNVD